MILITGSAGFIGYHTSISFLSNKHKVIGVDNINNYYDTKLKKDRINILKNYINFNFKKVDIRNKSALTKIFNKYKIKCVVHLAAQAGVRYSFENPDSYFYNNLDGFRNILDIIKEKKIKLLLYASSSSVYGSISTKQKFRETLRTDTPLPYMHLRKNLMRF